MDTSVTDDLRNCNFCKAVLMLAVVLCHSAAFYGGNWFPVITPKEVHSGLGVLSSWLGSFHVYAFTVISGYIFYYVKYERGGYADFRRFAKTKILRLLVPYFLISLLWVVPLTQVFYHYSVTDLISKYALGEAPSQLWFLLMLFGVFLIAYPLSNTFKNKPLVSIVVVGTLFVIGFAAPMVTRNYYQIFTSCAFIVYFWMGFTLRHKVKEFKFSQLCKLGGVLLIVNIVSFAPSYFLCDNSMYAKLSKIAFRVISNISGSVGAFLLLLAIARKIKWQESKIFLAISEMSFPIYLIHQQIIYVLLVLFVGFIHPLLNTIIIFVASTMISGVMSYALSKNKYTRLIIGQK